MGIKRDIYQYDTSTILVLDNPGWISRPTYQARFTHTILFISYICQIISATFSPSVITKSILIIVCSRRSLRLWLSWHSQSFINILTSTTKQYDGVSRNQQFQPSALTGNSVAVIQWLLVVSEAGIMMEGRLYLLFNSSWKMVLLLWFSLIFGKAPRSTF